MRWFEHWPDQSQQLLRMDGMAKLNHLLRIEEELGDEARYAGSNFRQPRSMKNKIIKLNDFYYVIR